MSFGLDDTFLSWYQAFQYRLEDKLSRQFFVMKIFFHDKILSYQFFS